MFEVMICKRDGSILRRFDLSNLSGTGRKVKIGRGDDCDIRIKSGVVSRHHCEIEAVEEDEWVVRDTGSTHGTIVDGGRIDEVEIEDGLEVSVGPALLRFGTIASRIGAELEQELGEDI